MIVGWRRQKTNKCKDITEEKRWYEIWHKKRNLEIKMTFKKIKNWVFNNNYMSHIQIDRCIYIMSTYSIKSTQSGIFKRQQLYIRRFVCKLFVCMMPNRKKKQKAKQNIFYEHVV